MSSGESQLVPRVGELWTLSWDGSHRGKVLIASVEQGFVTVFPVTEAELGGVSPAFVIGRNRTATSDMIVWSQLPTGIGSHLLSERVRYVITEEHLRLVLSGDERGKSLGDIWEVSNDEEVINNGVLHGIIRDFTSLCHHEWPQAIYGEAVLDRDLLEARDFGPKEILWLQVVATPRAATALYEGKVMPDERQTKLIADSLKIERPAELLRADESVYSDMLMSPSFKKRVHQVMNFLNVDERRARSIWLRSALELDETKPAEQEYAFDRNLDSEFDRILRGSYQHSHSRNLSRRTHYKDGIFEINDY